MSKGTAFRKISSIVDNKIWGCLADSVRSYERYEKFTLKYKKYALMEYFNESEIKKFKKQLKIYFNQNISIYKKDTMDDVIRQIKAVVKDNFYKL
jgi:hypothetical protein